jgi:putative ABC transport system permease protein
MTTKRNDWRATVGQMTRMGLRYLNGRRLRTTLTTLSIVFGVALIFAINLALPSMMDAFKQSMSSISGADIRFTSTSGVSFTPESVLPQVSGVAHVQAVTGILSRQFSIPTVENGALGSAAQIQLIGIDATSATAVRQFAMSEGRFLQADDSGAAVFPAGIADFAPELKIGTVFPLITAGGLKLYTVVGFLAEAGSPSAPEIYIPLKDAQAAFNQPGLINTIEVSIGAGADREAVTAAVQAALGDGFQLAADTNGADVVGSMEVGFAIFDLLGVLALFLGAFLIFNTFRTVILERRHDLAMLRAIGATQRQITVMIVIESLLQGAIGTAVGLVLGYLMVVGLVGVIGSMWQTYFHLPAIQLQANPGAFVIAIVLGMLTALLAGYWPARAAGRTSPLDALRPTTTASVERAARWNLIAGGGLMLVSVLMLVAGAKTAAGGAMLFLIGMMIAAPGLVIPAARLFSPLLTLWFAREGDLARSNLVRQPGRAAITGSTLMIGLAVLVLAAALVSAFTGLLENLAGRSFSSDILLTPQSVGIYSGVIGADDSLATRLRALPSVAAVGTMRYAPSTVNSEPVQVLGIDPNEYPKVATFDFPQGDAATAYSELGSGRTAFITSIAQSTLGVNVGDEMVLQSAEGPQTYRVVGVANDILTFKVAVVFISQTNMAADFHKSEDILLMANLAPGADKQAALTDVQDIVKDYPQFTAQLTGEYRQTIVDLSASAMMFFYILALLIIIPAAMGLLNTLTINILERTREIGVVRAVGGSQKQVRRMVTAEALLLGIFGSAMGVLTGVAISYGFIGAFGAIGWTMPFAFPLMGIIAAVVVGVLLALFASILPARSAAKLDIIRALQYE